MARDGMSRCDAGKCIDGLSHALKAEDGDQGGESEVARPDPVVVPVSAAAPTAWYPSIASDSRWSIGCWLAGRRETDGRPGA